MLSFHNSVANSFQNNPARLRRDLVEKIWIFISFSLSEQNTKVKTVPGSKSLDQIPVFQCLHMEKEADETIEEFGPSPL
jgi:hypothetical protein